MTQFIAHRVNTIAELKKIPKECGVEIDLRDEGGNLILAHDPFTSGENFEEYLKMYNHGTLILNIKSERVEFNILPLLKKYDVKDYFFLDSSFPMIYQLVLQGERNIAVRFSEYEGLDSVMSMKAKVRWVWVDCFTKLPIDQSSFTTLKEAGFKLCLVSPELQGRKEDLKKYKQYLCDQNIVFDAICTKAHNISEWKH